MESKTNAPSFTVSLRGYDRMEVDEYLDSLAAALGQVEQAEERVHGLQAHVDRLNARIADLEDRIRSDVPKSGAILGERIAIVLRSAEETAADTVNRAEAQAADLMDKAHQDVAAAEDQARGATQRGEEQARRIESSARAEAAEIIAEAESRASARTRQIEQWAEQVVSHTRSEEARMLKEQQQKRDQAEADLRALADERDTVAASIAELRDQLTRALDTVGKAAPISLLPVPEPAGPQPAVIDVVAVIEADVTSDAESEPEDQPAAEDDGPTDLEVEDPEIEEASAADEDEMPWPSAFRPVDDEVGTEDAAADQTGEIEAQDGAEEDQEASGPVHAHVAGTEERDDFDSKFDAWVTGTLGPRHFRRL